MGEKMKSDFINRKKEFVFIDSWVNTPANKNKGIFVYAKSGIGKSRFISEFFEASNESHRKIKVDVIGTDSTAIGSYTFLTRLYRKMIEETENSGQLPLKKRISTSVDFSLGYIAGINISFANTDKKGFAEDISKIMSYLTNKLSGGCPYIIGIENFQLIDAESLECFKQLFKNGTKNRFIFEFTMDPEKISSSFYQIFSQMSSTIECKLFELKKLSISEITILCEQKNLPLDAAKELYIKNDGNLFPLIMLQYLTDKATCHPLDDILVSLSYDQQMILFLIELARGEIAIKTVESIFAAGTTILTGNKKYSTTYLHTQFVILAEKKLIQINDNCIIKISQDQVLELIATYRNQPNYYLAWALYENYYYQMLFDSPLNNREPYIMALLHIYTIFPDSKIYSILPDLTNIILQYPPQKTIEKIHYIREQLEIHNENRQLINFLIQYLADVCIAVGQWNTALEQVENCYSEEVPWQACYLAATIAANPQIPDAENRILRMREKHKENITPYMSITVSLLSYYLRTIPEHKVRSIAKGYLKEFSKIETLNYAFLLKMYSNTMGNKKALRILQYVNKIFEKYHRDDLIVMNMITIASRYVYMGFFDIAEEILEKAEKTISIKNIPIRCHYLLNNKSAIRLLRGCIDESIEQDLLTAYFSTGSQFEKAIILCNLMIYYIRSQKLRDAENAFNLLNLLELSQYNNIDLKFILLKNTLYYYKTINHTEKIQHAKDNLLSFARSDDCPNDIRCHIFNIIYLEQHISTDTPIDQPFCSQFPFQAEFLGYWQCEVSYDSEGKNRLKLSKDSLGKVHFES